VRTTKRVKASNFLGVHPSGYPRTPWSTQIVIPSGRVASFGSFKTEREAAETYDRAVLFYRGPDARRNFAKKRLAPADSHAEGRSKAAHEAQGNEQVPWRHEGQCQVAGHHLRGKPRCLPRRLDNGAEGCGGLRPGRALLWKRPITPELPRRRLGHLGPVDLRRLAHASLKATTSSQYRGVRYAGYSRRPWVSVIGGIGVGPTKTLHLGTWEGRKTPPGPMIAQPFTISVRPPN
jgi:hypothetical protein